MKNGETLELVAPHRLTTEEITDLCALALSEGRCRLQFRPAMLAHPEFSPADQDVRGPVGSMWGLTIWPHLCACGHGWRTVDDASGCDCA